MSESSRVSDQFGGLPMDQLIGGPLSAACDAQVALAKATSDFITEVGFENGKVRMVPFTFEKPEEVEQPDGSVKLEKGEYTVRVPFVSIVSIPTLQVNEVDVNFMMEVKSSFSEKTSTKRDASVEAEAGGSYGPFSAKVKIAGSVSSSRDSQRSSDNSAKYDVRVSARQSATPEGLSRVLDILQQSIAPVPAEKKEAA